MGLRRDRVQHIVELVARLVAPFSSFGGRLCLRVYQEVDQAVGESVKSFQPFLGSSTCAGVSIHFSRRTLCVVRIMKPGSNYFEPLVTPRNLTIARRTNALIRYVPPGSSLGELLQERAGPGYPKVKSDPVTSPLRLPEGFEEKLAESSCASPQPAEVAQPPEEALAASCCSKCSRTALREAEVIRRIQHMLDLLANLSQGDMEVLRGLIDAKLAAAKPEWPCQDPQKAGPPVPRVRGY
jgi:hypothetical protein